MGVNLESDWLVWHLSYFFLILSEIQESSDVIFIVCGATDFEVYIFLHKHKNK